MHVKESLTPTDLKAWMKHLDTRPASSPSQRPAYESARPFRSENDPFVNEQEILSPDMIERYLQKNGESPIEFTMQEGQRTQDINCAHPTMPHPKLPASAHKLKAETRMDSPEASISLDSESMSSLCQPLNKLTPSALSAMTSETIDQTVLTDRTNYKSNSAQGGSQCKSSSSSSLPPILHTTLLTVDSSLSTVIDAPDLSETVASDSKDRLASAPNARAECEEFVPDDQVGKVIEQHELPHTGNSTDSFTSSPAAAEADEEKIINGEGSNIDTNVHESLLSDKCTLDSSLQTNYSRKESKMKDGLLLFTEPIEAVPEDFNLAEAEAVAIPTFKLQNEHNPELPKEVSKPKAEFCFTSRPEDFGNGWGKSYSRGTDPNRMRCVELTQLSPLSTERTVASLVWGGPISKLLYRHSSSSALVHFVNASDCIRYYGEVAFGIDFPGDNVRVVQAKIIMSDEPLSDNIRSLVGCGCTRCVRAMGIDDSWDIKELKQLARGSGPHSRTLEHVTYKMFTGGIRGMDFRFCDINDAVTFKSILSKSDKWKACNIFFSQDPCAVAEGVHG